MIRTASLAMALLAGALIPAGSASAAISINGRISDVVNALRTQSQFNPNGFTFSVNTPSGSQTVFKGLEGVRAFNDFIALNQWVAANSKPSIYNGGSYQFTHGVLGSYFGNGSGAGASEPAKSVYDGGSYKFTHSVLNSYFDSQSSSSTFARSAAGEPQGIAPLASTPVPEPASWAMMISGMALVGAMMRRRRHTAFA